MPRGRHGPRRDLTGHTSGRLRVLGLRPERRGPHLQWDCLCDPELGGCGKRVCVVTRDLTSTPRPTLSCGCLRDEAASRTLGSPEAAANRADLTRPVWGRVCEVCGTPFRGTARQEYCPEHRPRTPKQKAERRRAKLVERIRAMMAEHGITVGDLA